MDLAAVLDREIHVRQHVGFVLIGTPETSYPGVATWRAAQPTSWPPATGKQAPGYVEPAGSERYRTEQRR